MTSLKLGLLGYPVSHSASPAMHNAALAALQIPGRYEAIETPPGAFVQTLSRLRDEGFTGLNVTLPHKEEAFRLADSFDEGARQAGAANVLTWRDGGWIASNTDGEGLARSLFPEIKGLDGLRIVWIGSGGATLTAASFLVKQGAQLVIAARHKERREKIASALGAQNIALEREALRAELRRCDLLIQATPAMMNPIHARALLELLPLDALPKQSVVCDLVYRPKQTLLLQEAQQMGLGVVDGSRMLLHQGALAFTQFTGRDAPIQEMARALSEELSRLV
jgi:shikimate dehydrogenase